MNDVAYNRVSAANVIPFRRAAQRQADEMFTTIQVEALRETRRIVDECWSLRAESAAIKRRYEERQRKIDVLLAGLPVDVERA